MCIYIYINIYIYKYIYINIYVNGKQRKNYKFAVTLSFMLSNFQTAFIYREILLQVYNIITYNYLNNETIITSVAVVIQ